MKRRALICLLLSLILILCAVSCKEPVEEEKPNDFEASVAIIMEAMQVDRESAIKILEALSSLGLDAKIDSVYVAEDEDGIIFYKVWFGLNLFQVYLENKAVSRVLKHGEVIFPAKTDDAPSADQGESNEETTEQKIKLVSYTSRVRAGDEAYVTVVGEPNTEYKITVKYSSGASSARGLEPKTSDAEGVVTWTWKVSANVIPGEYSIEIKSADASYKTTFVVE